MVVNVGKADVVELVSLQNWDCYLSLTWHLPRFFVVRD
jgi:hypothetical protein